MEGITPHGVHAKNYEMSSDSLRAEIVDAVHNFSHPPKPTERCAPMISFAHYVIYFESLRNLRKE